MQRLFAARPGAIVALVLGVSFAACGNIGEPTCVGELCGVTPVDSGPGAIDGNSPDAMAPLGEFSSPQVIPSLASPGSNDDDPSVSADGLELYFNSGRAGGVGGPDLWVSRRNSIEDPWPAPTVVPVVNSVDAESDCEIAPDGVTLYFSSNRAGGLGGYDVYRATRDDADSPWSAPVLVSELNSSGDDLAASVTESGLILVMHSNRNAAETTSLYMAERLNLDDPWSTPQEIPAVGSASNDADPFISADGRTLYFDSNRDGGLGGRDIYVTTRASTGEGFAVPVAIAEINDVTRDADPWVSVDERTLVLSSNRSGDNEIYSASR